MDQNLVQVFFVQDEEISEAVGDDVCGASVTATYWQQTETNSNLIFQSQ